MTAKILIVDDEPSNLDTMEAFLVGEGYELHFAANGLVALEKARNVRPDLILLDVMMPELDGFAVTRRIRQDPAVRSMPIILVTAIFAAAPARICPTASAGRSSGKAATLSAKSTVPPMA